MDIHIFEAQGFWIFIAQEIVGDFWRATGIRNRKGKIHLGIFLPHLLSEISSGPFFVNFSRYFPPSFGHPSQFFTRLLSILVNLS